MPVVDISKNVDALSLTIVADFAAPVQRVWELYADPRQLERVWGPPEYPATVVDHDLAPGGRVNYYMTGPDGERFYGYWQVDQVASPDHFTFADGFADSEFEPNTDLPVSENTYTFTAHAEGTLRHHLCDGRGAAAGARHGHGRGLHVGDQPDRRVPRRLTLGRGATDALRPDITPCPLDHCRRAGIGVPAIATPPTP